LAKLLKQIEPNLAELVLWKKKFRFVEMKLILHE